MRAAYHADSALEAEALLTALARELDKTHPSAAASLPEGLNETLTVLRLDVPPTLARTLRSTNAIESMISICRDSSRNVKHWRDGQMALRWCAAGMLEAGKQFRRVNGHLHLSALRAALEREASETVGPLVKMSSETSPDTVGPPPKFHGPRDILPQPQPTLSGTVSATVRRQSPVSIVDPVTDSAFAPPFAPCRAASSRSTQPGRSAAPGPRPVEGTGVRHQIGLVEVSPAGTASTKVAGAGCGASAAPYD